FPHFPLCTFSPPPRHCRTLHAFPTRRSSDLIDRLLPVGEGTCDGPTDEAAGSGHNHRHDCPSLFSIAGIRAPVLPPRFALAQERSEEHTSELQSRFDLVCRLLLEKKKKLRCC